MANEILSKFAAAATITITLDNLASSTTGVGRQSTIIDNTTNRYSAVLIFLKVTLGTTPTANKTVQVYLIRDDAVTTLRSDAAGASDAALTVKNAELIGVLRNTSATTGEVVQGAFLVQEPGPKWGIAVVHDTGVNLNNAGAEANHTKEYVGIRPEVQ